MIWIGFIVLGFVSGSIPFALLIGRAKGVDIRRHGSGNVGATNVSRVLGRPYGLLCFALDAAKGAGPVVAAGLVQGVFGATVAAVEPTAQWAWLAVAVASVAGHMFSPFVGFRGGKGVATGFGSTGLVATPTGSVIWITTAITTATAITLADRPQK